MQETETTNLDSVLNQRGARYGTFNGHAEISQHLKGVIKTYLIKRGKELDHDQREALDMICHKIARILNGDPDYSDSWTDVAGYAKLVADRLEGVSR